MFHIVYISLLCHYKTNDPFIMYTLTEIILPIALTALFIYWIGTVINLLITLLFNKENK